MLLKSQTLSSAVKQSQSGRESADDYEIGTTRRGMPKIVRTGVSSEGWIAGLSGSGTYTRGTHGTVYVLNEYVGNFLKNKKVSLQRR